MKPISDEQLEHDLNIFSTAKQVDAPNFFYTSVYAKMEKKYNSNEVSFSLQSVLVIATLTLFIFLNSALLKKEINIVNNNTNEHIEALAEAYDQTISN
jgi:hypothetical protein